jgi:hypothetical protein
MRAEPASEISYRTTGYIFIQLLGIFLFTTASRTALGPTQPPIQWVPGALSLGVNRSGREADHSSPSSAEVKRMRGAIPPLPNTPPWCGAQLKHRDNFTFTYIQADTDLIQTHVMLSINMTFFLEYRSPFVQHRAQRSYGCAVMWLDWRRLESMQNFGWGYLLENSHCGYREGDDI